MNYEQLKSKVMAKNSTINSRLDFFSWFVNNETTWNGENYSFEHKKLMYTITPIYKKINEDDFILIDCEID